MKHELVHRYTCEGCGAERITVEEIPEFGPHYRGEGYGLHVETEAECIELTGGLSRKREAEEARRAEWRAKLVERCAKDSAFQSLTRIFPSELGDGEYAMYFETRMRQVALGMGGGMTLDEATAVPHNAYRLLLYQCIAAARAAMGGR